MEKLKGIEGGNPNIGDWRSGGRDRGTDQGGEGLEFSKPNLIMDSAQMSVKWSLCQFVWMGRGGEGKVGGKRYGYHGWTPHGLSPILAPWVSSITHGFLLSFLFLHVYI